MVIALTEPCHLANLIHIAMQKLMSDPSVTSLRGGNGVGSWV